MTSVGIIDTFGFVGAVEALDTCLKTADVEFLRVEKMSGGIVALVINGDVAAVSASITAGVEAARVLGAYRNHTIIARLDDQTDEMLRTEKVHKENPVKPEEIDIREEALEKEEIRDVISDQVNEIKSKPLMDHRTWDYSEEALNAMNVSNLRKLAREMKLKWMSKEEIKRSRKAELIANILRELKEEGE